VITSSSNLTRLRNEATALRKRQEFQRSQLTELASTSFESWAKESYEIATKIAYRNRQQIGSPKGTNMDCTMVAAAPVLPGYVAIARRIADSADDSHGISTDRSFEVACRKLTGSRLK
jgi:hypothetical protein